MEPTATPASMKSAAKARSAAGRMVRRNAAVIEAAKGAGGSVIHERAVVRKRVSILKDPAIGRGVVVPDCVSIDKSVVSDERPALRDIGIVVEQNGPVAQIEPPVVPAPAEPAEESDVEAETE